MLLSLEPLGYAADNNRGSRWSNDLKTGRHTTGDRVAGFRVLGGLGWDGGGV